MARRRLMNESAVAAPGSHGRRSALAVFLGLLTLSSLACSDLELRIEPERPSWTLGEDITVGLELVNRGWRRETVARHVALEDYPYRFEIVGPDGRQVRFLGPELSVNYTVQDLVELARGDTHRERIDIVGRLPDEVGYDITNPGRYTVTAVHRRRYEDEEIRSNTVTLTVVSP